MAVVMVITNHTDPADQVSAFGVPFLQVPATKDIRTQAEQRQLDVLHGNVDLVVLARYMQIITPDFLAAIGCPLDQHPSLIPAVVRRRSALSTGQAARRQTRRRYGPLRDRHTRRRTHHRTGRRASRPPPQAG
jgi:formyltetrahydrofolate hydrolase